ncbi:hypothetical protein LJR290_003484 [Variovorax sp. LjRoot290]|uniref:hypothetical protein n=1 Tax=Variovorax sp. LjRoot290 TaxID=3342316 RepID=UPI003ECEACB5
MKFNQQQEDFSVQLKNDLQSHNLLDETIRNYYERNGGREARNFLYTEDGEWGWHYTHFLIDRKHVIRYGYGQDRGGWVGGVELAIGPHYFDPSAFWSFKDAERFAIEATTGGVIRNLILLDEFLGYPTPKPWETPAAPT